MADILSIIQQATDASDVREQGIIQSLWSGYGSIKRYELAGHSTPSVIVKHVQLPEGGNHPRGWNTDISHQRKLKSYTVETQWYKDYAELCSSFCKVPQCLAIEKAGDEVIIIMEDLDAAGFEGRVTSVTDVEVQACLSWLAYFHATFLQKEPNGLWDIGTYWHLETRPDELKALEDQALKHAASSIDSKLNTATFKTFVHGDAKLANFCFSPSGNPVAAVDFQYVGGGCGMKDVAYFLGSCLYEEECESQETTLLDFYFQKLREAIQGMNYNIDIDALEMEWRSLYPFAWADFHRFLKGWSPGHWKINSYSERMVRQVIETLENER